MKPGTRLFAALAAALVVAASAFAAEPVEKTGTLTVTGHIPLDQLKMMPKLYEAQKALVQAGKKPAQQLGPLAIDPLAIYSNITTFSGTAFAQSPSAAQSGNQITRLVMDDITFTTNPGVSNVTTIRFSVANLNAGAVSVRPRLRFWNADGTPLGAGLPNGPGTCYPTTATAIGYSFNAISFANGVTTVTGGLGTGFAVPAGTTTTIWCGITFDNNTGATGATAAQMDNFGQGIFPTANLGSSTNTVWETTAAGSFFGTANPAGAAVNFGGSPLASMGWELVVTTLPVELQSFTAE